MKYALFIGRWQPFHLGHLHIIDAALEAEKSVLIAVRETPIDEANPYTAEERCEMIRRVFIGQPVKVMTIPDIESVNIGRGVGYDVIEYDPPKDIASISATEIRRRMAAGDDSWRLAVPSAVARYLDAMG